MATTQFKTDHGKYLRAEDGGGTQGIIVHAGTPHEHPQGLATGLGPDESAWQTFTFEWDGDVLYLKSSGSEQHGTPPSYGCAEDEGKDGRFLFNRESGGAWEALRPHKLKDGRVALEVVCRPTHFLSVQTNGDVQVRKAQAWSDAEQKMVDVDEPGGFESFTSTADLWAGQGGVVIPPGGGHPDIEPPPPGTYPDVDGPSHLDGRVWMRQGRPYTPHACHFMEMFSLWCRNRAACQEQILQIADISWSYGIRPVFRFLDTLGYYSYWRGREVSPIDFIARDGYHVPATPDYYGQEVAMLQFIKSVGGLVRWSCGDTQMFGEGADQIHKMLHDCDMNATVLDNVGANVMENWQAANEAKLNGVETPSEARQYLQRFKSRHPNVLCALGAPYGTEESDELIAWAQGADFGSVHGYRPGNESEEEFTKTLRHLFSVRREGYGHDSPHQPIEQGEPFGTGDDVSGGNTDNVEMLTLAAVLSHVTSQAWTYMSGNGVRWNGPIHTQPGFHEVLRATSYVPQDIYRWHIYRGGNPENPLAAVPGYYGDAGVPEGPARVDGASNGSLFWNVVYGGKPRYRVRATRALEGVVWNPATDERQGFSLASGSELELHYQVGRVVYGVYR